MNKMKKGLAMLATACVITTSAIGAAAPATQVEAAVVGGTTTTMYSCPLRQNPYSSQEYIMYVPRGASVYISGSCENTYGNTWYWCTYTAPDGTSYSGWIWSDNLW